MNKQKIELLRQQAQTYLMWAKLVENKEVKRKLLTAGKTCAMIAIELQIEDNLDATGTFEYKLAA